MARAASGLPHVYVTAPAIRAYNTPENRLLAFCLAEIVNLGRRSGWHRSSTTGAGSVVRERVLDASRWRAARSLHDVPSSSVTASQVARVRSGRRRRDYQAALDVYALHQQFVGRLDRAAIRAAVEHRALVALEDSTLLELMCTFAVIGHLRTRGWLAQPSGLLRTPLIFSGTKGANSVTVYYQRAPDELTVGSRYRYVQRAHGFARAGRLRPDLVLRYDTPAGFRWVLVEVKGVKYGVENYARAAALDLLAYRRALSPVLDRQPGLYGIGIAWGEQLYPVDNSEIILCSPDTIGHALEIVESSLP